MLQRKNIILKPNPRRVMMQFFYPGNEERAIKVIKRILALTPRQAEEELDQVMRKYSHRHRNFKERLNDHFRKVEHLVLSGESVSADRRLLAGAYFSKEYSIESAALFNPSIVPHPDQSGIKENETRFILSLRAAGEGHISSIEFRTGICDTEGNVTMDEEPVFVHPGQISEGKRKGSYSVVFGEEVPLQERVLFPQTEAESNGMEDARFVKLTDEDIYAATYTAYNGRSISVHMAETRDFREFLITPLEGREAGDKGMALFPRRVNGLYTMISRQDGENIYIMQSGDRYVWNSRQLLREPVLPWEFVQLGNCGSPVETAEGWLLLTHAVGPFRSYTVSALLLAKSDPLKVTGYLKEPLIEAGETEREGYVPNVVYTCGLMQAGGMIILPYAMSDSASGFAVIPRSELMDRFTRLEI